MPMAGISNPYDVNKVGAEITKPMFLGAKLAWAMVSLAAQRASSVESASD